MRNLTKHFILVSFAIIVAYDIYVYIAAGGTATISDVLLDWNTKTPFISHAMCVLFGHLFWPQKVVKSGN